MFFEDESDVQRTSPIIQFLVNRQHLKWNLKMLMTQEMFSFRRFASFFFIVNYFSKDQRGWRRSRKVSTRAIHELSALISHLTYIWAFIWYEISRYMCVEWRECYLLLSSQIPIHSCLWNSMISSSSNGHARDEKRENSWKSNFCVDLNEIFKKLNEEK